MGALATSKRLRKRLKKSHALTVPGPVLSEMVVEKREAPQPKTTAKSVLPVLGINNRSSRIGGAVTPQQVSAILLQADTGYTHRLVDLLNEARQKDCHLQSLLGTREAALTGLRWTVEPASRDEEDMRRARAAEQALRTATGTNAQESRSFIDMVSHLTGGVYFGYSVSETEWGLRDFEGSKLLQPIGFRNHGPRRFRFSESTGQLGWWDSQQPSTQEPVELQRAFPFKFLQHQPRINGDIPSREGLGRVLVWASIFRTWTISDWLRLAELAWKPWRMGRYKPDASTGEINGLISALELLTTAGVGVFSDRAEISVEWPERGRGGKPEHESLADWLGSEMSKATLGQTLTTDSGERGARSLGEVHDRVRKDIRELDAIGMSVTINRDLVIPMNAMNHGTDRPPPVFMFITDDVIDRAAFGRFLDAAVRAGMKIPMEWARDKSGIPTPQTGDEILMGRAFMEAEAGLILNTVSEFDGVQYNEPAEPADSGDAEGSEGGDNE